MNNWIDERTILLCYTGSRTYGTNTLESDTDIKGVCVPPASFFIGLDSFGTYSESSGGNLKNTKDDTDTTIDHISKFIKNCMLGSPNSIEMLFLEDEFYIKKDKFADIILDNRNMFLSKNIGKKYCGYAIGQRTKISKLEGTDPQRSLKYCMQAIRLLQTAIQLFETNEFSTMRANTKFLLDIRNGNFPIIDMLEYMEDCTSRLNRAIKKSDLPDTPDFNAVNNLTMEIISGYLKENS